MSEDWPLVIVLIITYERTELALRTIRAIKEKLIYPNLGWHIADDGSSQEHLDALFEAIGERVPTTSAERKGVGKSMNLGMKECLARGSYILWLEDDWELMRELHLYPLVQLLGQRQDVGMVRLGYISPGLSGDLISHAGQLWWKLNKTSYQYTFSGHASLRHAKFCRDYGDYKEGLTPGQTELWMCDHFNATEGPTVAIPVEGGAWGYFGHIGGKSLNDTKPETE